MSRLRQFGSWVRDSNVPPVIAFTVVVAGLGAAYNRFEGQFAPARDVPAISGAVMRGVATQDSGSARSDCTFTRNVTTVNGVTEHWRVKSTGDAGVVCIGPMSTNKQIYQDTANGANNPNDGRPFYPVGYFNTIGNAPQHLTYGIAAVLSPTKVAVQIANGTGGINTWNDWNVIQTIKVENRSTSYNPFAKSKRN